jgi:hypothetical protein
VSTATEPKTQQLPLPTVLVTHPAALLGCPVTDLVMYYTNGDRNGDFCVAAVQKNEAQGVLSLKLLNNGMVTKHPVRHVDDPFFRDHKNVQLRDGGWDWGPGKRPRLKKEVPTEIEAAAVEVIREWNNGNTDPVRIASAIRSKLYVVTQDNRGMPVQQLTVDPLAFVQATLGEWVHGYKAK